MWTEAELDLQCMGVRMENQPPAAIFLPLALGNLNHRLGD